MKYRIYVFQIFITVFIAFSCENDVDNYISENHLNWDKVEFSFTGVNGVGEEKGICRRDPSDIIKIKDKYYVFYTRLINGSPVYPEGYYGTIWYAVSDDKGFSWIEKGEIVSKGKEGRFDSFGVFTPNIVKGYDEYFYLYYTGVGDKFDNKKNDYSSYNRTAIGVTQLRIDKEGHVSNAKKMNNGYPILVASEQESGGFDSFRVDDAAIVLRGGKYWLYFKGRAYQGTPGQTKMGLAISDKPDGPFVKQNDGKPVQSEGHEVLVWPQNAGVVSMVTNVGEGIYFANDGIHFKKIVRQLNGRLRAPGLFREDLSNPLQINSLQWGLHMGSYGPDPYLERFEIQTVLSDKGEPAASIVPVPSQEDRAEAAGWSKGGNWMNQHEDINRIGQLNPKIDLVFLGNSITQSLGGPGRNVWSPVSDIWDEFFGHWVSANFGISGDRTQHLLWRIDNGNFDNINPRVIVLMIGTNNLSHDPAEDITLGIETIITRLESKVPGATILLMSIIRGESRDDPLREKAEQVNRTIRELDKRKNVQYVDLTKIFYTQYGQARGGLMRSDFVHFSLEGYRAWAKILQPYL